MTKQADMIGILQNGLLVSMLVNRCIKLDSDAIIVEYIEGASQTNKLEREEEDVRVKERNVENEENAKKQEENKFKYITINIFKCGTKDLHMKILDRV